MSKSLFQFLPQVMPEVDGCPDVVALEHVRNAAIELCLRGKALQVTLDAIDVLTAITDYSLEVDDSVYPYYVQSVTYNGFSLDPKTPEQLDILCPSWRTTTGDPQWFYRPDDFTLRLVRAPATDQPQSLNVVLGVAPTRAATTVDDVVFEKYYTQIAEGAKGTLMAIPKKQWSDPQQGAKYTSNFAQYVNAALAENLSKDNVQLRARPLFKFA